MSDNALKLTGEEVRELSQIDELRSVIALVVDWGVIFGAIAWAAHSPNPFMWLGAIAVVARQQHALGILMHDACHFRLFRHKPLNDWVGHWLCSAPLLFSLKAYRFLHLTHHKDPLAPTDPDLAINGGYPISQDSFKRKLVRDLTGRTFPKISRFYCLVPPNAGPESPWWALHPYMSGAIANVILFLIVDWIAGPVAYFAFWVLPLVTLLPGMLRIRAIVEHAGYAPNPDQSQNARTMLPSWQTWLMAPHNVHYHVEHHLYPSIPFFRLPRTHKVMNARNLVPVDHQFSSYAGVVKGLIR